MDWSSAARNMPAISPLMTTRIWRWERYPCWSGAWVSLMGVPSFEMVGTCGYAGGLRRRPVENGSRWHVGPRPRAVELGDVTVVGRGEVSGQPGEQILKPAPVVVAPGLESCLDPLETATEGRLHDSPAR